MCSSDLGNGVQIWDCSGYVRAYIDSLITDSHVSRGNGNQSASSVTTLFTARD